MRVSLGLPAAGQARTTAARRQRTGRGWRARLATAMLALLPLGPATALTPLDEADAQAWLARISAAADERSYRGTMVYVADGTVTSSRVLHYCDGRDTIERVEALDGQQQRIYRHNAVVHTVWPRARLVTVERRAAAAGLVSIRRAVEPRALHSYTLALVDIERVAGRRAQRLVLQPRDALRYAQRLWADLETGLLLRSEVLDAGGRVLEHAGFADIELDEVMRPRALLEGMKPPGFRQQILSSEQVPLEGEGWQLRERVPGFELLGCLKRPHGDHSPWLQLVFSDGLSFVSVFVEPFDEARHRQSIRASLGATGTLSRREGQHWLTATGDVPPQTLAQMLKALTPLR